MKEADPIRGDDALASAADPTRRALLRFIARSNGPVSRDAAAAALGLPRATVAASLDRLVEAGLLATTFVRINGRNGPGAGRPAKLYGRVFSEIGVSVPERRYDLAGDMLSEAVEAAEGRDLQSVIADVARRRGRSIGAEAGSLGDALETTGYEPFEEDGTVTLVNCPFDRLATRHTRTICGMNVALVQGMAEALGDDPARVCFAPAADRCCVEIRPAQSPPSTV